jgi:hypothetical protein
MWGRAGAGRATTRCAIARQLGGFLSPMWRVPFTAHFMRVNLLTTETTLRSPVRETPPVVQEDHSVRRFSHRARGAAFWRYLPDLAVCSVLVVLAFVIRRHGLPTNGLWLDDAEDAAGLRAPISHLLTVGFDHPGFIASLMGWRHVLGGDAALAYPAMIAGTAGPSLLYLTLRRFGYARSVGALLAAALVASETDIVYSGRVKTYTIDILIVLALVMIVPRLSQVRWRWHTALLWLISAILLASISTFALVATAAAGVIFLVHPRSDLRLRAAAVGIQAAAHLAFFAVVEQTYNPGAFDLQWRRTWDAFVNFNLNPVRFGHDALRHLGRVGQAFPGGPGWFATLVAAAAVLGLVSRGVRGHHTVLSRYLLLILVTAFVGSLLGRFPFGPKQTNPLSSGERVSLWLVPVIAVGLATILEALRRPIATRRLPAMGFDTATYLAGVAILLFALAQNALPYPFPGARSATNYVQSHLAKGDVLLAPFPTFSLAAESTFGVVLRANPRASVGFSPHFDDPRVVTLAPHVSREQVEAATAHSDRVLVYLSQPPFNTQERMARATFAQTLGHLGFAPQVIKFQDATVEAWRRGGAGNLMPSELPSGWQLVPATSNTTWSALLSCLRLPIPENQTGVNTMGPPGNDQLLAATEAADWSTATTAQSVSTALSGPRGAGCVQAATQSSLATSGYFLSATARSIAPTSLGSPPPIAYSVTASDMHGPLLGATVMFFHHGAGITMLICSRLGTQPFPPPLLSSLATAVANRTDSSP